MEFATVYGYLQELFPQIDARLLKAVAIENSKDSDAAVEVVLSEIFPYVSETAKSTTEESPPIWTSSSGSHSDNKAQSDATERMNTSPIEFPSPCDDDAADHTGHSGSPVLILDGSPTFWDATEASDGKTCTLPEEPTAPKTAEETRVIPLDQISQSNALVSSGSARVFDEVHDNAESEELILLGMTGKSKGNAGKLLIDLNETAYDVNASTVIKDVSVNDHQQDSYTFQEIVDLACQKPSATLIQEPSSDKLFEDQAFHDATIGENGQLDSYTFPEIVDLVQKDPSAAPSCEDVNSHENTRADAGDDVSEIHSCGNEAVFDMNITRSAQTVEVDLLEQIIEDAKSNKKTLFTAMESVLKTMKEVEEQESAVEQAREDATLAGLDIYSKVEELQKTLARAKEANDMHAGEVYGERAILATEVRELESRLLCLSDERDKSLAILDEMRTALEIRLAAAEQLRHDFECEKHVKEESALGALSEEEALMEKVVQESKRLQEEAEENTKLREFLMDRGHVVDTLQGEIAVICQDVKLLKQKFDSGVALSESISSGQTTCKLANSWNLDRAEVLKTPEKVSPTSSINGFSPKVEWKKLLLDDGWDICNKEF